MLPLTVLFSSPLCSPLTCRLISARLSSHPLPFSSFRRRQPPGSATTRKNSPTTRSQILDSKAMNSDDEKGLDLRCVNCGWGIERLYVQYSPGNIRLMKCESCKAVADPYIECEFMIILIDLILHKTTAYRHLLYNMLNLQTNDIKGIFWKSSLINLLLDAYRISILKRSKNDWDSSGSLLLTIWTCGKVLVDAILGNLMFVSILLLGTRVLLNSTFTTRCKDILLAILVSSYFKLVLMAIMVWEFPSSALFIVDIFVLSSNCVALKVLTQSRIAGCLGVCFSAHFAKFLTVHWLPNLMSGSIRLIL